LLERRHGSSEGGSGCGDGDGDSDGDGNGDGNSNSDGDGESWYGGMVGSFGDRGGDSSGMR
jgi:hypothetical protein